jgi:hypothetical protein
MGYLEVILMDGKRVGVLGSYGQGRIPDNTVQKSGSGKFVLASHSRG